jgi:hypothetical protein
VCRIPVVAPSVERRALAELPCVRHPLGVPLSPHSAVRCRLAAPACGSRRSGSSRTIGSTIAAPKRSVRAGDQPVAGCGVSIVSLNGISSVIDRQSKRSPICFEQILRLAAPGLSAAYPFLLWKSGHDVS